MLYGSATKEDLKNRSSVDESDSDLASDDTESSTGGRSSKYFLKKTSSPARLTPTALQAGLTVAFFRAYSTVTTAVREFTVSLLENVIDKVDSSILLRWLPWSVSQPAVVHQ